MVGSIERDPDRERVACRLFHAGAAPLGLPQRRGTFEPEPGDQPLARVARLEPGSERQRVVEMSDRLLERQAMERPLAGLAPPGHGGLPPPRLGPVARDELRLRFGQRRETRLDLAAIRSCSAVRWLRSRLS